MTTTTIKNTVQEMIEDIKVRINKGVEKEVALNYVLKDSNIGSGYKAQIRYEIKNYIKPGKVNEYVETGKVYTIMGFKIPEVR